MDSLQEPLDILPDLLRCRREEALDLISLISEHSSPKEVLIVIQETLEQLTQLAREDEAEKYAPGSVQSLINVIVLSTKSVPRSTLGKRTALSEVSPLVSGLSSAGFLLRRNFTLDSGREANAAEAGNIIELLLDTTVLVCASCIGHHYVVARRRTRHSEHTDYLSGNERVTTGFPDNEFPGHARSRTRKLSSNLHSMLMTSIQMNVALDESLFLISRCVTQDCTQSGFPPHLATSPCQQILMTLTSSAELPQMRAAAIGLLKEFVLEALQITALTMPYDYLSTVQVVVDIEKSLEPSRIAEVLSFYYVLVQWDEDNKTGIRDPDNIASVESSLLRPLRSFLEKWLSSEAKPILSVISLQIGLERIYHAVQTIRSQ
ncbi:hypothetical protein EV424DRAFT_1546402 [Suillus variegatus]|nr:hypothetical protein EV424DRAFT_1546402 [Suillus variegatus]